MKSSRQRILAGIAAVVSLVGMAPRVWADDCLPVVGRWSYGPTDSVEVAGSYAYFNSGAVLKIADLSDASQPVVVGEIDIEDVIEDLVVGNGHAFVVSHGSRYLTAIDVRNPEEPRVAGRLQVADGWWVIDADLEIDGTMVYLGDHGLGIVAIDVADPRHPEVVGTYEPPRDSYGNAPIFSRFAVDDGYVYVAAGSTYFDPASLRVIDFSSPSTPVEVGRIENPYFASTGAVSTSGDLLLFSASNGLYIVDISDPVVPVDVGLVAGHYGADQLVVHDARVYSADYRGLRIYDIADPAAPIYVARTLERTPACDVALGDQAALVALGAHGLQILDVSQLSVMTELGSIDTPGDAGNLTVEANVAYVADGRAGLRLIDVSQSGSPVEIGSLDTSGVAKAIAVAGGVAYVADRGEGVRVVDVGDPSSLVELGSVSGYAIDVDVQAGVVLVAGSSDGLRIVDVSDPSTPMELAVLSFDGWVTGVRREGDLAYLAVGGLGLEIIDVTVPEAPLLMGSYGQEGIEGLAVDHGYVFVCSSQWLEIVDARVPESPVLVSRTFVSHLEPGIEVAGGRAYLPTGRDGLRVFDVSDPARPVDLGFCETPGEAMAVRAVGDLAYLVTASDGLRIIDAGSPSLPPVVSWIETPAATEVIAVYEDIVYRVRDTGLQVFRMTSAGRPVELRYVELGLRPGSTAVVDGEFLYLAVSGRQGIAIVSLSSPRHPRLKGLIEQRVLSFDVEDSKVYTWVSDTGFLVFDTTDPTSPVEIGRIDNPGGWYSQLSVSGRLAIALGGETSIRLIDVSDPANPYDIRSYGEGDESTISSVELVDGIAVLSAFTDPGGSRIRSYDLRDPSSPRLIDEVELLTWSSPGVLKFNGRRVVVNQKPFKVWAFEARSSGLLNEIDDWKFYPTAESIAVSDRSLHIALGPIGFVTHDLSMTCEPPRHGGGRATADHVP